MSPYMLPLLMPSLPSFLMGFKDWLRSVFLSKFPLIPSATLPVGQVRSKVVSATAKVPYLKVLKAKVYPFIYILPTFRKLLNTTEIIFGQCHNKVCQRKPKLENAADCKDNSSMLHCHIHLN